MHMVDALTLVIQPLTKAPVTVTAVMSTMEMASDQHKNRSTTVKGRCNLLMVGVVELDQDGIMRQDWQVKTVGLHLRLLAGLRKFLTSVLTPGRQNGW